VDSLQAQQAELGRAEEKLLALPADLAQRLASEFATVEELITLDRALPMLTRFETARRDLAARVQDTAETAGRMQRVLAAGEQLRTELAELEPRLAERTSAVSRQQEAATAARTLLRQSKLQLESFRNLDDAKLCSLCGQMLTPQHRAHELQIRTDAVAAENKKLRESDVALASVTAERDTLAEKVAALTKERDARREEYRDLKHHCEQLQRETAQLMRTLEETFHELAEPIRLRIAGRKPDDWTVTTYPTADELSRARLRAFELSAARERLARLQAAQKSADELRAEVESLRRLVGQLAANAPKDTDKIRQRQARNDAELAALVGRINAHQSEAKTVQDDLDRFGREHADLQQRSADICGHVRAERAKLDMMEQSVAAALTDLPDTWRPLVEQAGLGDQERWKRELCELTAAGVEERAAELQALRANLNMLSEEESANSVAIAAMPIESRREVAEVEAEIQTNRRSAAAAEESLRGACDEFMRLRSLRQQRESLVEQLHTAERDHQLHVQLAELLGRDRLQRHLVRRAERQIVDYASAILDRLSGGELHLRLRGGSGESESAFDLEVINRAASPEPIAVAFLSGSQRFRVAVSLALGVGRYASGEERPIESVIVDEGFGCLDRDGRQVMIQELQNLRGFLKRILLVSHQEEFADAFHDGYHFELVDGSTRVTRVQR
jgi:DNA repair exonuclease SbcCD ATPase subunit